MRYTVSLTIDASDWHSSFDESDPHIELADVLTPLGASMHFLPNSYRFNIAIDADDPSTALSRARSNLSVVAGKAGLPDYPIVSISTRALEGAPSSEPDDDAYEVGELLRSSMPQGGAGAPSAPSGLRRWRLHRLGRVRMPRRS